MPLSNRLKNQHLLWRAGFGPTAENAASLDNITSKQLWQLLLTTSAKPLEKIEVANNLTDGLVTGMQDVAQMEKLTKDEKRALQKQSREDLKSLNLRWLDEMINSHS